jgi:hypothetical protein
MKEKGFVVYKLVDNGNHPSEKLDSKHDKKVLSVFPFAEDQPIWVGNILKDYYNVRAPFDVIGFFNSGGELTDKKLQEFDDLKHDSSHLDKVNGVNI